MSGRNRETTTIPLPSSQTSTNGQLEIFIEVENRSLKRIRPAPPSAITAQTQVVMEADNGSKLPTTGRWQATRTPGRLLFLLLRP